MSSSERAPGRRFVAVTLATVGILLGSLVTATAMTDPTGLLVAGGWPQGVCAPGIKLMDDRRLKPLMAAVHKPNTVLIGSSRVARGFAADGLGSEAGVVLNLGMTGATVDEIDALVRQTLDQAPVRQIWIGLDFGGAIGTPAPAIDTPKHGWALGPRERALIDGLLSPNALKSTLGLLRHPSACAHPPFDPTGFPNPWSRDQTLLRTELPDAATRSRLIRSWPQTTAQQEAIYARRMSQLERLLGHLQARGVRVILYRSPSHPAYDALILEAGLEPLYRRWQSDTERLAARQRLVLIPADAPDFLSDVDLSTCTTSALDCAFADAVHFRPQVGSAILRQGREAEAKPYGSSSMSQ